MSWSIRVIGKPENVAAELEKYGETLTGQSKIEFDDAKPFLAGLVTQNFVNYNPNGYSVPLVRLDASGSGSANGSGEQIQRGCQVKIETFYDKLV